MPELDKFFHYCCNPPPHSLETDAAARGGGGGWQLIQYCFYCQDVGQVQELPVFDFSFSTSNFRTGNRANAAFLCFLLAI